MATLLHLRQPLIAEWGATTATGTMLADLTVLSFYNTFRAQGWIGNLALHIEHALFGQDGRDGRAVEDHVRRLTEHLMPLLDRANRMSIRNLKAIKELRQGPVPAISIGLAEQVTVTNQQNRRAPGTGTADGDEANARLSHGRDGPGSPGMKPRRPPAIPPSRQWRYQ